jgi:hypothetical protein
VSVTTFSTIEGLPNPNGPPFYFIKGCGLGSMLQEKVGDEGRAIYFFANGEAIVYLMRMAINFVDQSFLMSMLIF